MSSRNRYPGINEYAVEVIRYRARSLVGKAGFGYSDVEDIEQDLMLDLFERLEKYDASKAKLTTYIDRIVDHKIANLLEERLAAKRDSRKSFASLDQPFEWKGGHFSSVLDRTSMHDYLGSLGYQDRSNHEHHILQIDLEAALRYFSPEEQTLLALLREMTLAEATRELGVARSTLAHRLLRIGKKLEKLGLDKAWRT